MSEDSKKVVLVVTVVVAAFICIVLSVISFGRRYGNLYAAVGVVCVLAGVVVSLFLLLPCIKQDKNSLLFYVFSLITVGFLLTGLTFGGVSL